MSARGLALSLPMSCSGDCCQNTWCLASVSLEAPRPPHGLCPHSGAARALVHSWPSAQVHAGPAGWWGQGRGLPWETGVGFFPDPAAGAAWAGLPGRCLDTSTLTDVTHFPGAGVDDDRGPSQQGAERQSPWTPRPGPILRCSLLWLRTWAADVSSSPHSATHYPADQAVVWEPA